MNKFLLMTSSLVLMLITSQPLWAMEEDEKTETSTAKRKIIKGHIKTKAGELFYRDSGGTGPVVLCIHGNSTDSWLFQKLMQENLHLRFIAFASPGHGKSFKASEDSAKEVYSFPGCAKTFLEALEQLKIKEFSVLGVSKGGHEAINLYALAPEKVKSLILSGTPPLPHFQGEEHVKQILQKAFHSIPAGLLTGKTENFTDNEARIYLKANGLNPDENPKMIETAKNTDGRSRALMFQSALANQRCDEVETLKNAKIPVLILGGTSDEFINYNYVKAIEWPPHVNTQIVEGENHSFVWNNPKLFNKHMVKHLSQN